MESQDENHGHVEQQEQGEQQEQNEQEEEQEQDIEKKVETNEEEEGSDEIEFEFETTITEEEAKKLFDENTELREKNESLIATVQQLQAKLKAKTEEGTQQHGTSQHTIEELQATVARLMGETQRLEEANARLQEQNGILEQNFQDTLMMNKQRYEQERQDAATEVDQMIEKERQRNEQLVREVSRANAERDGMRQKLKVQEELNAYLSQLNEEYQHKITAARTHTTSLEEEIARITKRAGNLEKKCVRVQEELEEAQNKANETLFGMREAALAREVDLQTAQSNLAVLEQQFDQAQQELAQLKRAASTTPTRADDEETSRWRVRVGELEHLLREREAAAAGQSEQCRRAVAASVELQARVDALSREVEAATHLSEQQAAQLARRDEDVSQLQAQVSRLQEQARALQSAKDSTPPPVVELVESTPVQEPEPEPAPAVTPSPAPPTDALQSYASTRSELVFRTEEPDEMHRLRIENAQLEMERKESRVVVAELRRKVDFLTEECGLWREKAVAGEVAQVAPASGWFSGWWRSESAETTTLKKVLEEALKRNIALERDVGELQAQLAATTQGVK